MSENRESSPAYRAIILLMDTVTGHALSFDACYQAICSRDARFDGRFFVGVTSTGIYCRPVCPANKPKAINCRFFHTAAAAHAAGFRPCLRCRPEMAPPATGQHPLVNRALALIAEGTATESTGTRLAQIAEQLHISPRQLRRLFLTHLGANPITVIQNQRLLFAKQLIHDTTLPMTDIALAAGFGSIRRFNETFLQHYALPPGRLRQTRPPENAPPSTAGVTLQLRYRPPFDWLGLLNFLSVRAIDGIEVIENESYRRTIAHAGQAGVLTVRHTPEHNSLTITLNLPDLQELAPCVQRIRRLFDLDADPEQIYHHLSKDPGLAPLLNAHPARRLPGGWSRFELGVRAILGQQISVEAARRLCGHLVNLCGTPVTSPSPPGLSHLFPTPGQLASANLDTLRMPGARKQALQALATAVIKDPTLLLPGASLEETIQKLCSVRGIGPWSAHYIAMRACREPDAFPASDVGLLRGATADGEPRLTPAELEKRATAWRPWRAYAAQILWAADSARQPPPGKDTP